MLPRVDICAVQCALSTRIARESTNYELAPLHRSILLRLYNSAPERGVNISELATTAPQYRSVLNVVVKLAVVGFYTQSMCHTVYHTIPYKDKPVTVATQIQIQ